MARSYRRGFTLLEMIFVVALISILSALAIYSARDLVPRFRARSAAYEMQNGVHLARTLAVERNKEVRLVVTDYDVAATTFDGNWAGAWRLEVGNKDFHSNTWTTVNPSTYDVSKDAEEEKRNVSLDYSRTGVLSGPSWCTSCTDSVVFNPQGWVANPAGDFKSDGDIRFVWVNKEAAGKSVTDEYWVRIYRGGMVRVDATLSAGFEADEGGTEETTTVDGGS